MGKTALLLIDIQNDYFPDGRNPLHKPERAAEKAKELLNIFRNTGGLVIHIQHVSTRPDATFFLADDPVGTAIHPLVAPIDNETVLVKNFPDSFLGTDLDKALQSHGIKQIVVCGMMTHMCIDTTVRSAKAKGYDVIVVEDACATKALNWNGKEIPADIVHKTFMAGLQGIFADVLSLEEWQSPTH